MEKQVPNWSVAQCVRPRNWPCLSSSPLSSLGVTSWCECRAQDEEDGPNLKVEASVHSLLMLRKVSIVWVNSASSLYLLK